MSHSRSGVSAMQVHRELRVTYKTAWRMMHKVRTLMRDPGALSGTVEVGETFIKAKAWRDTQIARSSRAFFAAPKS